MFKRKNPAAELRGTNRIPRLRKIAAKGCSGACIPEVLECLLEIIKDTEVNDLVFDALLTMLKLNAAELNLKLIIKSLSELALTTDQEVSMCKALFAARNEDNSSDIMDYTFEVALRHVGERSLVAFITEMVQK